MYMETHTATDMTRAAFMRPGWIGDGQKRIALAETLAGEQMAAAGTAEMRAHGGRQRLRVSIDAHVPDGTVFRVLANGCFAGAITVTYGTGELELDSERGRLPDGVAPVWEITRIAIADRRGMLVLLGSF
jgi:hypothetical protein